MVVGCTAAEKVIVLVIVEFPRRCYPVSSLRSSLRSGTREGAKTVKNGAQSTGPYAHKNKYF